MKQIVINKPYSVQIRDVKKPTPKPNEIVIKTKISGISTGTEKGIYMGNMKDWIKYPVYPGYEAAGIIMECGELVKDFLVGDRVISFGPHAEYVKATADTAVKIPDNLSFEKSTLAVLGTTAIHAIRRTNFKYGDTVTVIGLGVLGQMLLQHAKLAGAGKTIGIDILEERLILAKELGADWVINAKTHNCIEKVYGFIPTGSDVTIEVAGGAREAVHLAMRLVRDRGRVLIMGGGTKGMIQFPYLEDFFSKELEIVASRATGPGWIDFPIPSGLPPSYIKWTSSKNFEYSVYTIMSGRIKVDKIKTIVLKYTEVSKVYRRMAEGTWRSLHTVLAWE